MPPLVCLPTIVLDHSFPRDAHQLELVCQALGALVKHVQSEEIGVVLTDLLSEFVEDTNNISWERRSREYPLPNDIRALLSQWFLQPGFPSLRIDLSDIEGYLPHPLPLGCEGGLALFWSDEVGRLLALHDSRVQGGAYCVGIACVFAFAGEEPSQYPEGTEGRVFPIVGPQKATETLHDAYDFEVPSHACDLTITFSDCQRNYRAIGAVSFASARRDDHYEMEFPNGFKWTCDRSNADHIPEAFLKEICREYGYPLAVVKYALREGRVPARRCKLLR